MRIKALKHVSVGFSPVEVSCEELFMRPESAADANWAAGFVASSILNCANRQLSQFFPDIMQKKAWRWFNEDSQTRSPLLLWLWGEFEETNCL